MTRKDSIVLLLWCLLLLTFLSPVWGNFNSVFFNGGDMYAYHIPLRSLTKTSLQTGQIPFWNPYIFLGIPHAANPQSGLFYPVTILSELFPLTVASVWDQIFHMLWGGIGVFLLAKSQRLERFAAVILSSIYVLSPFLVYRVTAGIPTLLAALAWVPWLWMAWLSGQKWLLAIVVAFQLFSGHGQFLVINITGMILFAACVSKRILLIKRLLISGFIALILTAIQWVLTAQYLRESVRSNWIKGAVEVYTLQASMISTWVWPNFLGTPLNGRWQDFPSVFYESCVLWIGPAALLLVLLGLFTCRQRLPRLILLSVGFILALGSRGRLATVFNQIGMMSYLRTPVRWLFLDLWAFISLAGAGLVRLSQRPLPAGVKSLWFVCVFFPLVMWDSAFLKPQDPRPFLETHVNEIGRLYEQPGRILTSPDIANPNKTILYHLMNVNGYEAFYPKYFPVWAAKTEGRPAADASRAYVSSWQAAPAIRAGVFAQISPIGIQQSNAWPLAYLVDPEGQKLQSQVNLKIDNAQRWVLSSIVPMNASGMVVSIPYYPGWRGNLNGARLRLSSWEGIFQYIPLNTVSSGQMINATVEFIPTGWVWLILLTAGGWSICLFKFIQGSEFV